MYKLYLNSPGCQAKESVLHSATAKNSPFSEMEGRGAKKLPIRSAASGGRTNGEFFCFLNRQAYPRVMLFLALASNMRVRIAATSLRSMLL